LVKNFTKTKKLTDAATVAYLNSKYATLQTLNNFVSSDVVINPGYSSANNDKQSPFFGCLQRCSMLQQIQPIFFLHLFKLLLMF
jgi:hypothetical protein